jgi:L-fuculose-phosphate aldolase
MGLADELFQEFRAVGEKLHGLGMLSSADGNLSVRTGTDRVLITRSGAVLCHLTSADLLEVDLHGQPVSRTDFRPSTELPMHLAIYRARPEVGAVVHAHPSFATAFGLTGRPFPWNVLPEVIYYLGKVVSVPYATPGSQENAEQVRRYLGNHDVLLLEYHGAVTLGRTLMEAFYRMEKLEHAARTLFHASQLGPLRPLPEWEVEKLLALRQQALNEPSEGRSGRG